MDLYGSDAADNTKNNNPFDAHSRQKIKKSIAWIIKSGFFVSTTSGLLINFRSSELSQLSMDPTKFHISIKTSNKRSIRTSNIYPMYKEMTQTIYFASERELRFETIYCVKLGLYKRHYLIGERFYKLHQRDDDDIEDD